MPVHFRCTFSPWVIGGQEWSAGGSRDWSWLKHRQEQRECLLFAWPSVCLVFDTRIIPSYWSCREHEALDSTGASERTNSDPSWDPQCSPRPQPCLSFTYLSQTARTKTPLECDSSFIVENCDVLYTRLCFFSFPFYVLFSICLLKLHFYFILYRLHMFCF